MESICLMDVIDAYWLVLIDEDGPEGGFLGTLFALVVLRWAADCRC